MTPDTLLSDVPAWNPWRASRIAKLIRYGWQKYWQEQSGCNYETRPQLDKAVELMPDIDLTLREAATATPDGLRKLRDFGAKKITALHAALVEALGADLPKHWKSYQPPAPAKADRLEAENAKLKQQLQTANEALARQKKQIRDLTKALKAAREAAPESARLKAAKEQVVATGKALETARYELGRIAQALLGAKPKR